MLSKRRSLVPILMVIISFSLTAQHQLIPNRTTCLAYFLEEDFCLLPLLPCPPSFWDNALPAADFEVLLVRPSLTTFDAECAADFEVVLFGAPVCESALPADVFDLSPVESSVKVLDALDAALRPVVLPFVMTFAPLPVCQDQSQK